MYHSLDIMHIYQVVMYNTHHKSPSQHLKFLLVVLCSFESFPNPSSVFSRFPYPSSPFFGFVVCDAMRRGDFLCQKQILVFMYTGTFPPSALV